MRSNKSFYDTARLVLIFNTDPHNVKSISPDFVLSYLRHHQEKFKNDATTNSLVIEVIIIDFTFIKRISEISFHIAFIIFSTYL